MKHRLPFIAAVGVPLLMLFAWFSCAPVPVPPNLSVKFVGLTNNPVRTRPILAVAGNGQGLHAIFAVTNTSSSEYVRFESAAVERFHNGEWSQYPTTVFSFKSGSPWIGLGGTVWSPGHGTFYAVVWPPGMDTNPTWRIRLSVANQQSFLPIWLNQRITQRFRREVFKPRNFFTLNTPPIEPAPKFELLSVGSEAV